MSFSESVPEGTPGADTRAARRPADRATRRTLPHPPGNKTGALCPPDRCAQSRTRVQDPAQNRPLEPAALPKLMFASTISVGAVAASTAKMNSGPCPAHAVPFFRSFASKLASMAARNPGLCVCASAINSGADCLPADGLSAARADRTRELKRAKTRTAFSCCSWYTPGNNVVILSAC